MHNLRCDRNNATFDHYDYKRVGSDDHLFDLLSQAETNSILRKDYISTIMRDLRGVRFGNQFLQENR